MRKVKLFDRRVLREFYKTFGMMTTVLSAVLIFSDIPENCKLKGLMVFFVVLVCVYIFVWIRANQLRKINLKIGGNNITIKEGDIFNQGGLKTIAFNEYFDTQVDDKIISRKSLNGIFINDHLSEDVAVLDGYIKNDSLAKAGLIVTNGRRKRGKVQKYTIGTICKYNDFLITAFSKFDDNDRATLTAHEYVEFLGNFWINANTLYAQNDVSMTIFGSGITRIKGGGKISSEDLLIMMLMSLKISEVKFSHPASLFIIISKERIEEINLFNIKAMFS